jgi:hypothetical protein
MSQTAAHLVDHVIPHVPVRQWVLSLPIPLRVLLAAQPEVVTPVLKVVQRVVTRYLLDGAQLKADEGHGGAVTLIQRFGSAANLNVHLHCLVLDGVYRYGADGAPANARSGCAHRRRAARAAADCHRPTDEDAHAPGCAGRGHAPDLPGRAGCLRRRGAHAAATAGGCRHLPHRIWPPRRAHGADAQGRDAARDRSATAPVRRHRWLQSARRGAGRRTRPQAAGAAVPLHHPAGTVRRAHTVRRGGAGGAQAQDTVARRDHAPGDEPTGVHAAARAPLALSLQARHHRMLAAVITHWWRTHLLDDDRAREALLQPTVLAPGDEWRRD